MLLLDFQYWPSLSCAKQFYNASDVILEQYGNYQKQSLFNRCHITGRSGALTLSVPLLGGREQKIPIKDLQIDNSQRWAVRQLRTLKSCYGKAPFFDYYFPVVENLLQQKHESMILLNQAILMQVARWLLWEGKISLSESFTKEKKESEAISNLKPYVQVFAGSVSFVPNLSVLDGFMCMGPQLKNYLVD